MATGPGDEMTAAAGGRGSLRSSHTDREQVIDTLKTAFVRGRLTKDELDTRVGQVLASRTHADLAAVIADIPAGMAAAQSLRTPVRRRARKPVNTMKVVAWGASAISVLTVLGYVLAMPISDNHLYIFVLLACVFIGASATAWGAMVEARTQNRSRRRLPHGPAPGAASQASQRITPAVVEAEQLPQINHVQQRPAETVQSRLPRVRLSSSRPPRRRRPRLLPAAGRAIAVRLARVMSGQHGYQVRTPTQIDPDLPDSLKSRRLRRSRQHDGAGSNSSHEAVGAGSSSVRG